MSILVYLESAEGSIKKSSLEAVSYAKELSTQLGGEVLALVLGNIAESELSVVGQAGASQIIYAKNDKFSEGIIQVHAEVVSQVFQAKSAKVLVLAKSSLGDAVAARLSVKLKAGLVSNVVSLPDLSSGFVIKRSIYTGKAFAETNITTENKILAVKKNTVDLKTDGNAAPIEIFEANVSDSLFGAKITATDKATGEVLLPEADIVVSGGRGMKGPENWGLIEDLAHELGAATGCSKPVSDIGWRPHHEHVGQTGVKVSPTLYIAVGISGAIQHLAGVNSSKNIVVINKDPEAPFFKAADYGIVGDAFEVLPKLTQAIKAIK
jgi:electron transfer flavoprotein alpha subunit